MKNQRSKLEVRLVRTSIHLIHLLFQHTIPPFIKVDEVKSGRLRLVDINLQSELVKGPRIAINDVSSSVIRNVWNNFVTFLEITKFGTSLGTPSEKPDGKIT